MRESKSSRVNRSTPPPATQATPAVLSVASCLCASASPQQHQVSHRALNKSRQPAPHLVVPPPPLIPVTASAARPGRRTQRRTCRAENPR